MIDLSIELLNLNLAIDPLRDGPAPTLVLMAWHGMVWGGSFAGTLII